ncbi:MULTISPECIES: hypothetical protein [Bacillaceae]|uniref:Uncharacterized protein n=1 Tax=Oceanobacillus caeni TaxID=405946 RepID=A0ABR5MHK6_9BACI|nr:MULTISPECIES: hypothetical protein [Bacillaceae]KPH73484.1 hypothetical protein AFL42_12450 [Oceanobacillus caeni]MED4474227.1 hypothetical protein [Oceanobacillus caeni]
MNGNIELTEPEIASIWNEACGLTYMLQHGKRTLSPRYTQLATEIANFARDSTKLLVENGWMEQPPIAPNCKNIAK